jgi:hypothetical protein
LALVAAGCGGGTEVVRGGRWIAWANFGHERPTIWIARADGSARRVLVRGGVAPRVSPDGRWVAYTTGAARRVLIVPARGGRSREIAGNLYPVTWSPTSRRLVGWRRGAIFALDLDGRERRLHGMSTRGGWSFSPDGRRIVFADGPRCHEDVYVERVSGGTARRITHGGLATRAIWTARGILFARDIRCDAYSTELWFVDPAGGKPHRLASLKRSIPGYYGIVPIDWRGTSLLAGIATEWGDIAVAVDSKTGGLRHVHGSWYASGLSRDGKRVLLFGGGGDGPYTIAWAPFSGGRVHVVAHGDVGYESWNG